MTDGKQNTISTYMGRPITDLTREELIEALEHVGIELIDTRKCAMDDMRFMNELHLMRELAHREGV